VRTRIVLELIRRLELCSVPDGHDNKLGRWLRCERVLGVLRRICGRPWPTAAGYWLRDQSEVTSFLETLLAESTRAAS